MSGKWEYKVVEYPKTGTGPEQLVAQMNSQGAQGWELVQADPPYYYFKRPKVEVP